MSIQFSGSVQNLSDIDETTTDVVTLIDGENENPSVADLPSAGHFSDDLHNIFNSAIVRKNLNHHLWQKRHFVLAATIEHRLSLLMAVSFCVGDRYAGCDIEKCVDDLIEFVRLNMHWMSFIASNPRSDALRAPPLLNVPLGNNAKSFRCSSTTKEDECHNEEQRNQNKPRVHHIATKRRHFNALRFRDAFYHEVGSVSDVGIGSHKDRSTRHGSE